MSDAAKLRVAGAGRTGSSQKVLDDYLVALQFSSSASQDAIDSLVERVEGDRDVGGLQLVTHCLPECGDNKPCTLLVGASTERILEAAEIMEMRRIDKRGLMLDFTFKNIDSFLTHGQSEGSLFSMAERQYIVLHELEGLRAGPLDASIPGHPNLTLYPGKPLLHKYKNNGLISKIYALHDKEELKKLGTDWYKGFIHKQPLAQIRQYFGEHIAMYFAFLGFYTLALVVPMFVGVVMWVLTWYENINKYALFAGFNLIWVTLFLEAWKRHCSELAYVWGTLGTSPGQHQEPRPAFKGIMAVSEVTGKLEPHYPWWKRQLKKYLVTGPVVVASVFVAFIIMIVYMRAERQAENWAKEAGGGHLVSLVVFVPTVVYTVVILAMNYVYRIIMQKLTQWENHRLQSAFENNLIIKLVVFDFINCFGYLFYVAFFEQDMEKLKRSLTALLITQQIVGQCLETVFPYLMAAWKKRSSKTSEGMKKDSSSLEARAHLEAELDPYIGTFDDYLELFLQFGYAFLFSSVFPLAALWAFLNNVLEIRSDAFKLCRVLQRPFANQASDIGAWQVVFEIMGIIAVITNCALVGLSPHVQDQMSSLLPDYWRTPAYILFTFVIVEHVLIAIKCLLAFAIPDIPGWVLKALARTEYLGKQALKNERAQEMRKQLMQRHISHKNV